VTTMLTAPGPPSGTSATLPWGWQYVAVRPSHFRVDYVINPYMSLADQPDPTLAMAQWQHLVDVLVGLGARVDVLEQVPDAPDMVYAMNLGLAITDADGPRVALSHMRYPQRRVESGPARAWFADAGFAPTIVGERGIGAHLEAGDAFPFAGELVVGYGPRTDRQALEVLAADFGITVRGVRITHPDLYHLDLGFCPLDATTALVCPAAFDEPSTRALLATVPDPIVITEEEAHTFCANSVVLGSTVVMPACPDRVRVELERRGLAVALVDVSEFHKGGGSIRCLTNPLDIEIGRDLDFTPGGRVLGL
jgi:arginine dihydrolase